MSDISDSEKRLIGALDRIDYFIERVRDKRAVSGDRAAEAENIKLRAENASLRALAEEAQAELTRKAADDLGKADDPSELETLRAEFAALQQLRNAEIAQLEEIIKELETLLGAGAETQSENTASFDTEKE